MEEQGYQRSSWGKCLSRRWVLKGATLGGAALAAVTAVGCAQEERPAAAPGAAAPQPKRGGIIARRGGTGNVNDTVGRPFDPHAEIPQVGLYLRLVHNALLAYDLRTYEVQPDLAQSWEQPSQTEYILKLRPGVRWHNKPPLNGRELRPEDVIFSLNRVRTDRPVFIYRSVLNAVDRVEAVDRATIRVTTKQPDATIISALGADPMLVLAPEVAESTDRLTTVEQVVGTGPFIMKDVSERVAGEYIRNPDYFQRDLPYLDGIRTPWFADDETAYAAFIAGRIDIGRVPGTKVKDYIGRQAPGFTPDWFETPFIFLLTPQMRKKPFDDPRVTRALRLLIDHQEFLTTWAEQQYGHGRFGSILPAALGAWDVPQEEYRRRIFWQQPKDPALKEALELLNAAGFTRDNPLRFELAAGASPTQSSGIELLEAQFRRNSQGIVQAHVKLFDSDAARSRAQAQGDFEYMMIPVEGAIVEPGVVLNQIWRTGGSQNYGKVSDLKLDELIDRQNRTFDLQERKRLVREIVLYMMDNSPSVPGALTSILNAVSARVRGFTPEAALNGRQYQWLWVET